MKVFLFVPCNAPKVVARRPRDTTGVTCTTHVFPPFGGGLGKRQVAAAVGQEAFKEGVAGIAQPGDLEAFLRDRMWTPAQQKAREQSSKI